MKEKAATFVKELKDGFTGDARLYKVSPPLEKFKYVVVSATNAMYSGPETYIFGADKDGNVLDWGELEGSYQGGLNHSRALEDAGYSVRELVN